MTSPTAFEAVAEPTRRRILDLLLMGERPVGDLVTDLGMNQPGVSRHLRVLRDAGLVSSRTDAQRRLYSVNPGPLAELDAWLAPYRRLWARRLDQLERHLDDMTGGDMTGEPGGSRQVQPAERKAHDPHTRTGRR